MKLVVSLIAILFTGSVLLVNAASDAASDARPKAECKAASDPATPAARC
jgi:hypothetical protein